MKTTFIALLVSLVSLSAFAQIKFESGYFIDNDDKKVSCLIQNREWSRTPLQFNYKLSETSEGLVGDLSNVKEFGLDNASTYIRMTVNIDTSPDDMQKLSNTRAPIWAEQTLFLQVLTRGKATLYVFRGENGTRFFYRIGDGPVQQLVYKKFYVDIQRARAQIGMLTNDSYKQQLYSDVRCGNVTANQVKALRYSQDEMEKYFRAYNKCSDPSVKTVEVEQPKKKLWHVKLTSGAETNQLELSYNRLPYYDVTLDKKTSFRLGAELEFIIPFKKNTWSLFLEPTYRSYKSEGTGSKGFVTKTEYTTIDIALGGRHYFHITDNAKVFVDVMIIPEFPWTVMKDDIDCNYHEVIGDYPLSIYPKTSAAFGGGIAFKKFSAEVRYYTPRAFVTDSFQGGAASWDSDFKSMSLVVGYRLF